MVLTDDGRLKSDPHQFRRVLLSRVFQHNRPKSDLRVRLARVSMPAATSALGFYILGDFDAFLGLTSAREVIIDLS
jgi:hypothetical protein